MAWSGFGQTHLVWKQAGVQESSGPVSGRTQPARYQFSTFRLGCVLPQTARIILCKTSPDPDLVLADCVRFWPNGSGPEASRCARIIRPVSGHCFPADVNRIRHVYWGLTEKVKSVNWEGRCPVPATPPPPTPAFKLTSHPSCPPGYTRCPSTLLPPFANQIKKNFFFFFKSCCSDQQILTPGSPPRVQVG